MQTTADFEIDHGLTVHNPGRSGYVSFDLETTGLDPEFCQILEVGAVIDDLVSPIDQLPTLSLYVLSPNKLYGGDPYALQMNAEILKEIHERHSMISDDNPCPDDCVFGADLGSHLADWLDKEMDVEDKKYTFAGKNFASFDLQFLKSYGVDCEVNFRHRSIDPGSMYWDPSMDGFKLPDLKTCLERANLPNVVTHRAVEDAMQVVKLVRSHLRIDL